MSLPTNAWTKCGPAGRGPGYEWIYCAAQRWTEAKDKVSKDLDPTYFTFKENRHSHLFSPKDKYQIQLLYHNTGMLPGCQLHRKCVMSKYECKLHLHLSDTLVIHDSIATTWFVYGAKKSTYHVWMSCLYLLKIKSLYRMVGICHLDFRVPLEGSNITSGHWKKLSFLLAAGPNCGEAGWPDQPPRRPPKQSTSVFSRTAASSFCWVLYGCLNPQPFNRQLATILFKLAASTWTLYTAFSVKHAQKN